jgi:trimethylguanosine synthase
LLPFGKLVIAIEIDPVRLACARHNAKIYGVEHRIEFILGDSISFLESTRLKPDAIFLSPPWGGPQYLKAPVYEVDMMPINWYGQPFHTWKGQFSTIYILPLTSRM